MNLWTIIARGKVYIYIYIYIAVQLLALLKNLKPGFLVGNHISSAKRARNYIKKSPKYFYYQVNLFIISTYGASGLASDTVFTKITWHWRHFTIETRITRGTCFTHHITCGVQECSCGAWSGVVARTRAVMANITWQTMCSIAICSSLTECRKTNLIILYLSCKLKIQQKLKFKIHRTFKDCFVVWIWMLDNEKKKDNLLAKREIWMLSLMDIIRDFIRVTLWHK